ncbi:MAG TPA: hypothetical protein VFQ69_01530 [Rhizomicrobium sp.]|jgi:hypothetical protein|nr:hypothetical protein [Rhizomicrobium sp.]
MQGMLHGLKHLALIAMILRAMLPAGWMPASAVPGEIAFTICSVDSAAKQQHDAPARTDNHDKPCAFTGAPQLAAAPDAPALALPAVHAAVAETDRAIAARIAAQFQPHSPRAPPLNA